MIIPDYISPVIGHRVWQWNERGLRSLNGVRWKPGNAFAAECKYEDSHNAPNTSCTCGVYAIKSVDHLIRTGLLDLGICGEVFLWGTVVEHEEGWRAQFAYPKSIVVPEAIMPLGANRLESWLTALIAYGCDIFVTCKAGTLPLWSRGAGYDGQTLDLLIERSKSWYTYRLKDREIKRGDRVAVLGRGIAVVEHVGHDEIRVVLWSRDVLRVGRREIIWHDQNGRWEAALVAGVTGVKTGM